MSGRLAIGGRATLALWLLLEGAAGALAGPPPAAFTDVSIPVLKNFGYEGRGGAWVDADGDGDLDLSVTNWGIRRRLFRNDGGGQFFEATFGVPGEKHQGDINDDGFVTAFDLALILGAWGTDNEAADLNDDGTVNSSDLAIVLGDWSPPIEAAFGGAGSNLDGRGVWGDYDNDGDMDFYVTASQGSALLRNEGGFVFTDASPLSDGIDLSGKLARGASWIDHDRDGDLDLYIAAHLGSDDTNRFFRNNGDGTFTDDTPAILADVGVGRGISVCDFDNDGDQDMYLCNGHPGPAGEPPLLAVNRLFRNDGGGAWTRLTGGPLGGTENSRGAAWGDYDNDGDFDLYIANLRVNGFGGNNRLARNDGGGVFTDVTVGLLADNAQSRDCSWVDYDNDGDLDLFVVDAFTPNFLFQNDGAGNFTSIDAGPLTGDVTDGRAAAWADFDADGDLDCYLVNATENFLIRNDLANGNHWLILELEGVVSNRSAIGARVTVTAGGLTQIREVQSGSGYLTQHMLPVHFGLGGASMADTVEIRWPSGVVQTLNNVPVDQWLLVIEDVP